MDRAAAVEDCSRLALEAEQSSTITQAVGEALAVLKSTVVVVDGSLSPDGLTTVSAEVASAVAEAEGLVDGILRVIQVSARVCFVRGFAG